MSYSDTDHYYDVSCNQVSALYNNQALMATNKARTLDVNVTEFNSTNNQDGTQVTDVYGVWEFGDGVDTSEITYGTDELSATINNQTEGEYPCKVTIYDKVTDEVLVELKYTLKVYNLENASLTYLNLGGKYGTKYMAGSSAIISIEGGFHNWFTDDEWYYNAKKASVKWTFRDSNGKTSTLVKDSGTIAGNDTICRKVSLKSPGKVVVTATIYDPNGKVFLSVNKNLYIYKNIKNSKITTYSSSYTGKSITPKVVIEDGTKTLTKNVNYTVTGTRKTVGSYTVTIKGKGYYTDSLKKTFVVNPAATKITKIAAGKKSLAVSWTKKSNQTSGYQVMYSTSSKFSGAKTITLSSTKITKKTIKGLKSGKKYYVKVRTYKTVSGKKYYSNWTSYRTARVK